MKNRLNRGARFLAICLSGVVMVGVLPIRGGLDNVFAREDVITLRVCSWEEYIDLGGWDEEERMELDNGVEILGERALYDEFEEWYYEAYGKRVQVEYSCFGTNEDLYNQLTLGDTYDLVCPSDYMIMKLMAEGELEPYSESFFDGENEENYYARCVSPYIADVFAENQINGESWSRYAACYMWGVTGVLYNPELMTREEASTWAVFDNPDFYRQITLKDNVRDTYFSTLGYLLRDQLTDEAFLAAPDYREKLGDMMNDVSPETIDEVEKLLGEIMGNIYALETDSGKADMVTGKIIANYQWSGDAVYAMDQAEEDDLYLQFAVPRECTNLWFDGWVMLKDGIGEDMEKKQAAEAFVNFLSRPVNAVRNMYYIGYTSAISGGEDDTVFSYLNWCYGADDAEENTVGYPVGYFFSGNNEDEDYIVYTSQEQVGRQLYTQYPSQDVIARAAVMWYFDEEQTRNINQMWINIRCLDVREIPLWCVVLTLCIAAAVGAAVVVHKKNHYCG
ncbi:MAG: extracellular solute-binding protein [Acetatifactor sp.]|nr:extracellular solute-binding protein [Acetatifactor sp.]